MSTVAPPTFTPNPGQQAALDALSSGKNVFLTGVAGCGKSWTCNTWIKSLPYDHYVAKTASTGAASVHIGGMTLHRYAGVGLCQKEAKEIVKSDRWRDWVAPRIQRTRTLLVDEISMIDGRVLTTVDRVCQIARGNKDPFGGLQIVFVGDFGQLPPVEADKYGFAFETRTWWEARIQTVELTQAMRTQDRLYSRLLQVMRDGDVPVAALTVLAKRVNAYDPVARGAVRLFTHNVQVDQINEVHLDQLPGQELVYNAYLDGSPENLEQLVKNCPSPEFLRLRVGARVMFTRNDEEQRWVNGTLATVTHVEENGPWVKIDGQSDPLPCAQIAWETKDGDQVLATFRQYPLRLAWALTVHRCQGSTLDLVSTDLSRTFAPGQSYVALSRCRTLDGLNLEKFGGRRCVFASPKVKAFMKGQYVLPKDLGLFDEGD